jgi:hypothetical protein
MYCLSCGGLAVRGRSGRASPVLLAESLWGLVQLPWGLVQLLGSAVDADSTLFADSTRFGGSAVDAEGFGGSAGDGWRMNVFGLRSHDRLGRRYSIYGDTWTADGDTRFLRRLRRGIGIGRGEETVSRTESPSPSPSWTACLACMVATSIHSPSGCVVHPTQDGHPSQGCVVHACNLPIRLRCSSNHALTPHPVALSMHACYTHGGVQRRVRMPSRTSVTARLACMVRAGGGEWLGLSRLNHHDMSTWRTQELLSTEHADATDACGCMTGQAVPAGQAMHDGSSRACWSSHA